MKIKICGMKYPENIKEIDRGKPDYLGFIFYRGSPRCINPDTFSAKTDAERIGVFVDETFDKIEEAIQTFRLKGVQLHGSESPELCGRCRSTGAFVIKAFAVDEHFDFGSTAPYQNDCNYFLFDTKTEKKGGSGLSFDWNLLANYQGQLPFFLSGGIGPGNVERIMKIDHPALFAVDVNSAIETAPGRKDPAAAASIINTVRNIKTIP